jgi:hypothetical protein
MRVTLVDTQNKPTRDFPHRKPLPTHHQNNQQHDTQKYECEKRCILSTYIAFYQLKVGVTCEGRCRMELRAKKLVR